MRLLLDAHFDPTVARVLREHGHAGVSVLDLGPDRYQASDLDLLEFASVERRALVTRNVRDFILLHALWAGAERTHAGIVLVHARTIPEGNRGAEIRALEDLLQTHRHAEALADTLVWLPARGGESRRPGME